MFGTMVVFAPFQPVFFRSFNIYLRPSDLICVQNAFSFKIPLLKNELKCYL